MSDVVRVEINGPVMEIVFGRSPVNAINVETSTALYEAFEQLNDDDGLLVGIVTSEENDRNIFCAGWDLKALATGEGLDDEEGYNLGPGGAGGLPEFFDFYKPVIVAVNGNCVGAGVEMLLASDLVVMEAGAYFLLPEAVRGFVADSGTIQRLHHRIPYNVAMDLMLTGRQMYAEEAMRWGLVRDVVPKNEVLKRAREIAAEVVKGAPLVTRALKEYMRYHVNSSPEEGHLAVREVWRGGSNLPMFRRMLDSPDFQEGVVSFAEKRKPRFGGD